MKTKSTSIRAWHLRYIKYAIYDAEGWRGNIDPEDYGAFDVKIEKMKEALQVMKNIYEKQNKRRKRKTK